MKHGAMISSSGPQGWHHGLPTLAEGELFGNVGLADVMLVAGVVMLLIFFMSRFRQRKRKEPPTRLSVQEQMEKEKQTRALQGDMEQVMVEIETMSRRVGAQLDAKSARLEELITQADRRIEQLKQLETTATSVTNAIIENKVDATRALIQHVEQPNGDMNRRHESAPDALAQRVYALADEGLDATAIAGELREHIGKVELILALRVK